MPLIVFVPGVLCTIALLRWSAQQALINVCLPTLLLCPTYYYWNASWFPEVDMGMAVFMPIAAALFLLYLRRWKLGRADLWLFGYIFSSAFAEYHSGHVSGVKFRLFNLFFTALVPYMAGKLLIEPNKPVAVARRIVALLILVCLFSIPQFFININLFSRTWERFFPGQWPRLIPEIRWHFVRVAGPYHAPELAGMVFLAGIMLALWLWKWNADEPVSPGFPRLRLKLAIPVALVVLTVTLLMTESRGPWLGVLAAMVVASIGRARNVARRASFIVPLLLIALIFGYMFARQYSNGRRIDYGSTRETAQYRRELLQNYLPVAQAGGAWGWGQFFPVIDRQTSIDNQFLLVFLMQGYVGATSFLLLVFEGCYAFARLGFRASTPSRRHFGFTMLGILIGWSITLLTVYLGAQTFQMFFLLIGWSQASPILRRTSLASELDQRQAPKAVPAIRVYT